MCGIFGWQFPRRTVRSDQLATLATALVMMNDARGGDGWGWWAPGDVRAPEKDVGRMQEGVLIGDLIQHPALVGHTRYATKGEKSRENAHPFIVVRGERT